MVKLRIVLNGGSQLVAEMKAKSCKRFLKDVMEINLDAKQYEKYLKAN